MPTLSVTEDDFSKHTPQQAIKASRGFPIHIEVPAGVSVPDEWAQVAARVTIGGVVVKPVPQTGKHAIRVIQTYRTVRACTIEVEAVNVETAMLKVDEGEIELPPYDDPRWTEEPTLQDERTRPA